MKPKNRVLCPDCGRMKMLFETEKKALNFIKFNGEEIGNSEELRVYYCPACCGYHISSHKYTEKYEHHTDELIQNYKKSVKNFNHELEGSILCDDLLKMVFLSKYALNEYLKSRTDVSESAKDFARNKYYRITHLNQKIQ